MTNTNLNEIEYKLCSHLKCVEYVTPTEVNDYNSLGIVQPDPQHDINYIHNQGIVCKLKIKTNAGQTGNVKNLSS